MSDRLTQTIRELDPQELRLVEEYAESLVRLKQLRGADHKPTRPWGEGWMGAMSDEPEASGVEAQATAMRRWRESIERGLAK